MAIDAAYKIIALSGKDGTDGESGTGIKVQYSVNGTSNWHATFTDGDIYMRQSTDNGTAWSDAMRIVGEKGEKGDPGANGTSLTSKGNWASGTAYKVMEVVYYATNKTSYVCKKAHTASSSILPTNTTYWTVLAAPGTDGTNGTNGTNATQYYMHFVYCDDTSSGSNYSTTESRKYVGIYTDTTQADAATFDTAKAKSGIIWSKAEGEDGDDGTSVTITSKSVKYQAGTSGTTAPTGTWSDTVPSVTEGQYLWTKTEVTYSDGTSTTSYSVGYAGTNGTNGTSPWTVTCSEPSLTLACGAEKTVTSEKSITIKFNAFQGTSRKAATIATSTLPSGVTVTSNTAATTSADGSLVLKVAAGASLGGTTAAYNTVIITLTVTANGVAYTFSLTLSKQVSGQWQSAGWLDLTAATYDTNTWYPVTGTAMPKNPQKFQVSVRGDGQTNIPWSSHNTGKIGVEFCVEDVGIAWGWINSNQCTIFSDTFAFTKAVTGCADQSPVSYTQMSNSSTPVIWLRGGAKYYVEATYNVTWTIRAEATTISSQTVTPSANTRPTPRGVFVRGKGISTVAEYYKLSASTTETFDSSTVNSWSTSPSSLVPTAAKPYLLNAERITLTDGVSTTYEYKTPHICLTYQEDGADGRGITSITNVYKLTTNTTKPEAPAATDSVWTASATGSTSVWGTVCPTTTTANKYLWNCERIEFDDGTYTVTPVALMSTHGATGAQGGNGTDTWSPMLTSVTRSRNKFTKSTNTANWDSQFYSKEGFKRCFISWKVTQTNGAIMVGLNSDPAANANWTSLDYAIFFKTDGTYDIRESNTTVASASGSYTTSDVFRIEFDGTKVNYYKGTTLLRSVARAEGTLLYADSSFYTYNKSIQDVSFGALGEKGATGSTGDYTKRIPLYYVSTSTTAPAKPTTRITATGAATTTTWTQGKYTGYSVGKYYYTCTQTETYNSAGTYQSSSWDTVVRDMEYENAGTAKLRAAGKYIGKKTAAFTAYTATSNWDWFLATADFTVNSVAVTAGNVYVWNGTTWAKDTDTSHLAAAMNDMMTLVDTYTTDSTSVGAFAKVFAQQLAARTAFINQLFTQQITIGNGGVIYGGNRYNADGTINNIAADGFWIGANGVLKARLTSDAYNGVYIGTDAGKSAVSSSESVFIGTSAGENVTGASNVAIGTKAMKNASNTSLNVAIGYEALAASNTNGNAFNVAVGYKALTKSTTGHENVGLGSSALGVLTTGAYNIGIGTNSLIGLTTGSYNIGLGLSAGAALTTGQKNIFIGNLNTVSKANSEKNILLGNDISLSNNGSSVELSSGNIIIGNNVSWNTASSHCSDSVLIGNNLQPSDLHLGNGTVFDHDYSLNIMNLIRYQTNFYLSGQSSITGSGCDALILPKNVFCKNGSQYARLDGVKEYAFGTNNGYIKYANGLIINYGYHADNGASGRNIVLSGFTETPCILVTQLFNGTATNEEVVVKTASKTSFYYDSRNNRNIFWFAIGT